MKVGAFNGIVAANYNISQKKYRNSVLIRSYFLHLMMFQAFCTIFRAINFDSSLLYSSNVKQWHVHVYAFHTLQCSGVGVLHVHA